MRSIRTRLTLAYAGAMIGTMLALATALYSVRRVSVMRELEARLNAQADFAVQLVDLARDISPSQLSVTPDSVVTSGILPRMKPLMDLLPNYLVVIDRRGFNMYRSDAVERLLVDQKGRIDSVARAMKRDSSIVTVNLIRSTLLMTGRNVRQTPSSTIDRVFVAMSVDETETQLRELLGTIVVTNSRRRSRSFAPTSSVRCRRMRRATTRPSRSRKRCNKSRVWPTWSTRCSRWRAQTKAGSISIVSRSTSDHS